LKLLPNKAKIVEIKGMIIILWIYIFYFKLIENLKNCFKIKGDK